MAVVRRQWWRPWCWMLDRLQPLHAKCFLRLFPKRIKIHLLSLLRYFSLSLFVVSNSHQILITFDYITE